MSEYDQWYDPGWYLSCLRKTETSYIDALNINLSAWCALMCLSMEMGSSEE